MTPPCGMGGDGEVHFSRLLVMKKASHCKISLFSPRRTAKSLRNANRGRAKLLLSRVL
jgi:hypothetical protein